MYSQQERCFDIHLFSSQFIPFSEVLTTKQTGNIFDSNEILRNTLPFHYKRMMSLLLLLEETFRHLPELLM